MLHFSTLFEFVLILGIFVGHTDYSFANLQTSIRNDEEGTRPYRGLEAFQPLLYREFPSFQ